MVEVFNRNIKNALDNAAPLKTFKIRSNYRFGLSENTKELMKKRLFDLVMISKSEASKTKK